MNKPSGGRGRKAPYETIVVRVPTPILPQVEVLIDNYRNSILSGNDVVNKQLEKSDVIEAAKKILKSKQSAKLSILKLLQVLYGDDITDNDLK